MTRFWTTLLAICLVGSCALAQKKDNTGTVTGTVTARKENWIEVKGDGEEKARRYFAVKDTDILKAIHGVAVGSRVRLEWKNTGHLLVSKIEVLRPAKKEGGTVTGTVTDKGPDWIVIRADGEQTGRRYMPHWRGGLPKDGGGLDKKMLAEIKSVPLNSRVRIEWVFEERPRVEKIEVLKKGDGKKKDRKADKE